MIHNQILMLIFELVGAKGDQNGQVLYSNMNPENNNTSVPGRVRYKVDILLLLKFSGSSENFLEGTLFRTVMVLRKSDLA